jgi:hypothetical protein
MNWTSILRSSPWNTRSAIRSSAVPGRARGPRPRLCASRDHAARQNAEVGANNRQSLLSVDRRSSPAFLHSSYKRPRKRDTEEATGRRKLRAAVRGPTAEAGDQSMACPGKSEISGLRASHGTFLPEEMGLFQKPVRRVTAAGRLGGRTEPRRGSYPSVGTYRRRHAPRTDCPV